MATQKAISTISYNNEAFLVEKLNGWIKAHIIQSYMYIKHKGEDGDKDHIHLRIEPNKRLDAMDLTEQLREFVVGQKKPLGVLNWRPSKEEDWLLYVVHDKDYLRIKYAEDTNEKLPYSLQDIVVSDGFDVETAFVRAKASLKHTSAGYVSELLGGKSVLDLMVQGANPFMISTINRAITDTRYSDLATDYNHLQRDMDTLLNSIDIFGFDVVRNEDGELVLSPREGTNFVPF